MKPRYLKQLYTKYFHTVLFFRSIMAQSGRLISTLILQCIASSLANQNLVPLFISDIGKPLIWRVEPPCQFQRGEPLQRDCERADLVPRVFSFEIRKGRKIPGNEVGPFDWNPKVSNDALVCQQMC